MELAHLIESVGYAGIAAIVFSESGLFIGAFLPGDSLLFTAGFLASQGIFNIYILAPLTFVAAVLGDSFGYAFGKHVGPKIFKREDSLLFHRDHLIHANKFYTKHGAKTIVIARFLPIVRTFAPILAGVGNMHYSTFLSFNVIGAFLWAIGLSYSGYYLGQTIPHVDRYLLPIIAGIILASVAPTIIHILRDPQYRRSIIHSFRALRLKSQKKIAIPQDYTNADISGFSRIVFQQPYSEQAKEQFRKRFRDAEWISQNVALNSKTTYRLGGPADFFAKPKTVEQLKNVLAACRELHIPFYILGGGSNVLFSDAGWRGVIIQPNNTGITFESLRGTKQSPLQSEQQKDYHASFHPAGNDTVTRWETVNSGRARPPLRPHVPDNTPKQRVTAGAGVSLQQLITTTHSKKLIGLESFSGIPCRVGGALRNNVHGGPVNFDAFITEARLINAQTGVEETWQHGRFSFDYDTSILQQQGEWIVWDVTLTLYSPDNALWKRFDEFLKDWQAYKSLTQTSAGTGGCVFKNIPKKEASKHGVPTSAGALIDSLFGLDNALRTAKISHIHGNFFQTDQTTIQQPTSNDMLSLINFIREQVKETVGIELENEIELVGF